MSHMKSCAKSKNVDTARLVQLLRESKEMSSALESGPSSSSRLEGEEGEGRVQTRRSRRLAATQSKSLLSSGNTQKGREDEDFTMAPPPSGPPSRRGRKRKRDNLQDK